MAAEIINKRAEWVALLRERFNISPSDSPCGWPVAKIRASIAGEYPRFRNSSVRVIRRGHALVVELDNRCIFKHVWHPRANLKTEIEVLGRLKGRLGIETPDPVFIGRGCKFFGYPRIKGNKPDRKVIGCWSPEKRSRLASELVALCGRVQEAIPLKDRLRVLGPKPGPVGGNEIDDVARRFRAIFYGSKRLITASRKVFDAYKRGQKRLASGRIAFVGFDLQFDNLLLDSAGRLVGAVDFGYLTWSDAPGLFGLLYKDDPELAEMVMAGFERFAGGRISAEQAKAQGLFSVWSYLVEVSTNRWDMASRRGEFLNIAKRFSR